MGDQATAQASVRYTVFIEHRCLPGGKSDVTTRLCRQPLFLPLAVAVITPSHKVAFHPWYPT